MSEIYDEEIQEDPNTSSLKEESNQYYEDFSSSSSQIDDKSKKKKDESIEKSAKNQKLKSSSSFSENKKDDQNEYKQDFEEEEQEEKVKILEQKIEVNLKPTQAQINKQNIQKQDEILENSQTEDNLKNTIDDEQLKKQQLSFIDNLNMFLQQKQTSKQGIPANQSSEQPQDNQQKLKDNQQKSKDNQQKPPLQNKQTYIKDYINEKPQKKIDIESVPNDDEIDDIIRKNQNNFLSIINNKSLKPSPNRIGDYQQSSKESSFQEYYDEEEEEDLHVIYETDREDSQGGKTSHNDSYDNQYYSEYSVYQQLSNIPGQETIQDSQDDEGEEIDASYYEDGQIQYQKLGPKQIKKLTQKQYERVINEKKLELKQLQELQKLKENLNINIDENDEDMIQISRQAKFKQREIQEIKIMQDRMKYGCRKCAEANPQKDRESLREESEHLRKVINDQEAQIKILKVQLRKTGDRALDNSFSSIGSASTNIQRKLEDLELEKGKLKQDNLQLRQELKDLKKASQSKLSRQQRLNTEIYKSLGQDLRQLQEKELKKPVDQKLETQFRQSQERLAELRLDLEKMIKKYEDQKQKIKDRDDQIINLKQKVQGRHFSKQMEKIEELQGIVDNYEKDKEQIRDEMQLDKQLELIFPNSITQICHFFNICVAVEEVKRGRYQRMANIIYTHAKPFFSKIAKIIQTIKDTIKFSFTKKPIHHPHQQEIIRATVKAWNDSPDILARQLRSQQKELKEMRIRFIEMDKQIESQTERNVLLEKDIEILRQRNTILETKLQSDKNKLINNVIIQLKHHTVEDDEDDYLFELKKLINIIKEGPPILISQAEKDEFKKQQELEAQKERKKREMEERKHQMQLKKYKKLEEKQEKLEKERQEEQLKQKTNRPSSALRYKSNLAIQSKDVKIISSALVNQKKTPNLSSTQLKVAPNNMKQEGNVAKENNSSDVNASIKDSKNFRVSNLTSKQMRSSLPTNSQ